IAPERRRSLQWRTLHEANPMTSKTSSTSRRTFLTGAASTLAALPLASAAGPRQTPGEGALAQAPLSKTQGVAKAKDAPRKLPAKGRFPVVVISSPNGLEATRKAYELMLKGTDPLDA